MDRCFGVIAEFNPFHNGHAALLAFAREKGASHILAVMSGNAVQRGGFAIADKRVRANAALLCGADLVLELPLAFSLSSARPFAAGAVRLLKATGIVDAVFFGSESGDAGFLAETSVLADSPELNAVLKQNLETGMTFARAKSEAARALYGGDIASLLSSPNDILALEYMREIRMLGWNTGIHAMRREGVAHNGSAAGKYASASYLRENTEVMGDYIPEQAARVYRGAAGDGFFPSDAKKLETAIISRLRSLDAAYFRSLPDISEGLENRFYNAIRSYSTLEELLMGVKTKRYTLARIRRLALCAFLGIRAGDAVIPPPYARVLGFNKNGAELLAGMKTSCALPVDTSLAALEKTNAACARFAFLEASATDQYALTLPCPPRCGYEYTASAVFIK